MANRSMNTHRREMRPVTPVGRIGRNAAGAAITASLLVGGAGVALADSDAAPANSTQGAVADAVVKADATSKVDASSKVDAEPKAEAPAAAAPTALAVAPAAPVAKTAAPVALPASAEKQSTEDFGDLNSAAISTQVAPPKVEEPAEEDAADDSAQKADKDAKKADKKQKDAKKRADKKKADDKKADKDAKKADEKQQEAKKAAKKKSASKSSVSGNSVVSTARGGLGVRYVWGGSTRNGWDCSGFTAWVYRQHGVNLPHSAAAQRSAGRIIPRSQARPGDLVYTPGHIGIYAGNGRIIDAGTSIKTTRERKMWSASWTFVRVGR